VNAEAIGAAGGSAATATTTADSSGHWSLSLPSSLGSTTITVTSTKGRATGYAQEFVSDVALPGTSVLTVTDPSGDDNGPGTYRYPTAADFQPGAFDLLGFQVSQTATDVYLQAKIRNLASTFGSSFGAQLLDVYVRNPAAASTSGAAAYSAMNYAIAPENAWSQRLEAQGFAPVAWSGPSGGTLGSAQLIVDQPTGTATLVMPRSVFGTVGPGWTFTVVLTGQGSGSPPVRNFTATAQPFSFGVCAPGGTSPICSADPNTVPTVMDTITPAGVSQHVELDPTLGPAVLHGVPVP
jgi:glucoamylase